MLNTPPLDVAGFLESLAPYDSLSREELTRLGKVLVEKHYQPGEFIYRIDEPLDGVHVIVSGDVEVTDRNGQVVSRLSKRQSFGERGLMRSGEGLASTTAQARSATETLLIPAPEFRRLIRRSSVFDHFFYYGNRTANRPTDLNSLKVEDLITRKAIACSPDTPVFRAARIMRDEGISCLGVLTPGTQHLVGIVTVRDLANRVLAEGLDAGTPVSQVMTANPPCLPPTALGADVLRTMMENNIGHLPIVHYGDFYGIITQTDLTRFQAVSSALMIHDISQAKDIKQLARLARALPKMLTQLVASQQRHEVVTRQITDVTDAITKRLLAMAQERLGPAPVPFLWLACGSQGRQEQTGVSDQDNCLFLDDSVTPDDLPYFEQLARFVCDGLNDCGYVYCPGDMMATNPRWRQPISTWRHYFQNWMTHHAPESHMLASVMFDLRPIGGNTALYDTLQAETLQAASKNTIFMAHMVANSLKHTPPLGLIRGFSTIRTARNRHQIDLKHNGVIPVTDLARVYALQGQLTEINTRARLQAAGHAGIISSGGTDELIAAYDLIATLRLESQVQLIRSGQKPDNYLTPSELPEFQRNHLRDAFVVVRTMQASAGHGRHVPV
ncbi:MAG: cyclic nucleotide-binding/CBS domain-containing protein [Alcaligenaceae bacterium]|nr:cyclic nucleotide-binding/CBS domain-containing protein [Alcaligenaceae bacterium]